MINTDCVSEIFKSFWKFVKDTLCLEIMEVKLRENKILWEFKLNQTEKHTV